VAITHKAGECGRRAYQAQRICEIWAGLRLENEVGLTHRWPRPGYRSNLPIRGTRALAKIARRRSEKIGTSRIRPSSYEVRRSSNERGLSLCV